jgi:plasmid stabilization system protein ParE
MAKINWRERATLLLEDYIENASVEYGKTTAQRWVEEIAAFEDRVRQYPFSYSPEQLLLGKDILYRKCQIMKRRFKLIYYYDEAEDAVHVIDIWDTKMNPKALIRRIR